LQENGCIEKSNGLRLAASIAVSGFNLEKKYGTRRGRVSANTEKNSYFMDTLCHYTDKKRARGSKYYLFYEKHRRRRKHRLKNNFSSSILNLAFFV
jgi:hypothetical protein